MTRFSPRQTSHKRRTRHKKALRHQLWPEFSLLIRKRDGKCLYHASEGGVCGGPLQASHIYPRGEYPLLMLYPLNVKTLCWRAHLWWHNNPLDAHAWLKRTVPPSWLDQLNAMKVQSLGRKRMTAEEIRAEWKLFGLTT